MKQESLLESELPKKTAPTADRASLKYAVLILTKKDGVWMVSDHCPFMKLRPEGC